MRPEAKIEITWNPSTGQFSCKGENLSDAEQMALLVAVQNHITAKILQDAKGKSSLWVPGSPNIPS